MLMAVRSLPHLAAEAQVFSMKAPELFFSLYSPPKSDNAAKAARDRLEEDIKFASKVVCHDLTPILSLN
jgi:syntaxin-binding protein 1